MASAGPVAMFFDDRDKHIDEVAECPTVTTVKVEPFDGVNKQHLRVFHDWIISTEGITKRYVLFDWDQTLTQQHSISVPLNVNSLNSKRLEEIITELVGGEERLEILRSILRNLHSNGIKIIILTSNPAARDVPENKRNRDYFLKLAHALFKDIPFRIICSSSATAAKNNKRDAIILDEEIGTLCSFLEAPLPPSANMLVATLPPKGSGKLTAAPAAAAENNNESNNGNILVATTPGPRKRGGTRKHKRRTIKLRRFMRRLKATRHGNRKYLRHT